MTGYVRTAMIDALPPPARALGLLPLLRKGLFATPLHGMLTLLAGYLLYGLLSAALPWLAQGVWNATSLADCRAQIAAAHGPEAAGPCWAMIRLRWNQFIFGLYPVDAYWRPALAFALLVVALVPVLYGGLRRPAVIGTGTALVLLVLSLWGLGTDGWHIGAAAAVFAGLMAVAAWTPARLIWLTLFYPLLGYWLLWGGVFGLPAVQSDVFGGFLLALVIGVTAIAASLPMGILLALGRRSGLLLIRSLSIAFIEFFRGVPLITVLFAANFLLLYFLPPRTNFDLILRVVIVVVIFASAYIAEVIRGGLAALPTGQYEAADALGLSYWQAQRLIILPQAMKISIPGIVGSFIGLFKDTTLVALVGLMDPLQGVTRIVRADIEWKALYWEPYIFVGAIFFLICFGMSRYSMWLERKLKTDHR